MPQFLHVMKIFTDLVCFACWGLYSFATAFYIGSQSYSRWLSFKPIPAHIPESDSDFENYFRVNDNRAPLSALPTELAPDKLDLEDDFGAEVNTGADLVDDEALQRHKTIILRHDMAHDRASVREARNDYFLDILSAFGLYLLFSIISAVCLRLTGWRWVRWW
jgi:hypothetical protein